MEFAMKTTIAGRIQEWTHEKKTTTTTDSLRKDFLVECVTRKQLERWERDR